MERSAQAAPERVGFRRLAPPASLSVLLLVVAIVGCAWALSVPPWQSPDELDHFAYAQSLAENFALPGNPARQDDSSDETLADDSVGASRTAFYPSPAPPDWNRSDYAAYLARVHSTPTPSKSDGGGPNGADPNPPLYYAFADIGYLLDYGGTAFGRLYAMRISGVLLLVLNALAAWLLAGESLGRRRLPQLGCAAVAGLLPMTTFISTSVNPDAMLITLWTFALWLGTRVINHRARPWDAVVLCAVTALAILTKATSYALIPPLLLAFLIGWRRRPAGERRAAVRQSAAAGLVLLVPVLAWLAATRALGRAAVNNLSTSAGHPVNIRQFLSYVWQFYLPRLPFMTLLRTTPGLPVYDVWLRQGLGTFGWLDVFLPAWLYNAGAIVLGAVGIGAVGLLSRVRDRTRLALLAFFSLTLVALLVLLHASEYLMLIAGSGPFLQGRYLLPVVGLLGLAVGLVIKAVPVRARPSACGLVLAGLLALQVISLSTVVRAYYL